MSDFLEWLKEFGKPEIIWFIIGLLLIMAEFAMPGLIIIYFGLGAIFTAIVCMLFGISINVQILLFVAFSIISLFITRRYMKKVFKGSKLAEIEGIEGQSEYIGHKALVVADIEAGDEGKVEFQGANWRATADENIAVGKRVVIIGHKNITLKVREDI